MLILSRLFSPGAIRVVRRERKEEEDGLFCLFVFARRELLGSMPFTRYVETTERERQGDEATKAARLEKKSSSPAEGASSRTACNSHPAHPIRLELLLTGRS